MGPFYPAIVFFPSQKGFRQPGPKGLKVSLLESLKILWVASPKLLHPIRLQVHLSFNSKCPEPEHGQSEAYTIRKVELMAPSEKAQACSSLEECPLVTRKPFLPDVVPKLCSQRLFIQNVLHVHLDQRKRPLLFPGPVGRIEGFPPLSPAGVPRAPQDVAARVGRENQAFLLPEVPGKLFLP